MIKGDYSFSEFGFSSKVIRDLSKEDENVKPFIGNFFSVEQLEKQIKKKNFTTKQREDLYKSLLEQNSSVELTSESKGNIELLKEDNTYTIVAGHQLNLVTGPLYSIYKIIQIITWAEEMNAKVPEMNFVPVFWMATEDHDFEEINHINLFNSKIEWNKMGQENSVAGKIKTSNFNGFREEIISKFSDELIKSKVERYLSYYDSSDLATSTRLLLNELFGEYGLVIIDGDDKRLKQSFLPIIEKELNDNITFNAVSETNKALNEAGYHTQVHLRECNLFYIDEESTRHRIIKTENGFEINNNFYSKESLLIESREFPERFSPNALLRPVYQESILPNLVYFGGGGEIAYWLQLRELFNDLEINFPLLRVRDSYVLLSEKHMTFMGELNYSLLDLKQNIDDLTKVFTKENSTSDISVDQEMQLFEELRVKLNSKIKDKDLGLKRFVEGELVKFEKQLKRIEKKLIQSEKKNLEQSIKQIQKLRNKIYPSNGFQERYENFLQYAAIDNFIETIKKEAEQSLTVQPQIKVFKI